MACSLLLRELAGARHARAGELDVRARLPAYAEQAFLQRASSSYCELPPQQPRSTIAVAFSRDARTLATTQ